MTASPFKPPTKAKGFSLVEIMLYVSVAMTVSVLSVVYGSKLVAEQDARNAAAEMLILRDTVIQAYSFRTDFTGLTTASFLSTHQAPSFLALADNSGLVIPEIKASVTIAEELTSITGVQKPSFAIFVRDLSTSDCSVIAARLGSSFSNVVVNGSSVIDSDGFRPDLASASCSSMQSGNVIKLVSERTNPWVACRNLGTQFEEDSCPVGFTGTVTYSREYSCAANAGFEPGTLGPRTETGRVCCIQNAPQTEVRSDCPAGFTGTKTWAREYSCAANSGNEPGAWNSWHISSNDCKADCSIPWGGSIAHGANVRAWQSAVVPFGSSCQDETRTCWDGVLSGFGYTNQNCSVAPPASCSLPWGGSVSHGSSANAYASATVPYGSTCSSESRPCFNGTLSGSYSFQNCVVDPPPDACLNIPGVQSAPPGNGTRNSSTGNCSCNTGYSLNLATGLCDAAAPWKAAIGKYIGVLGWGMTIDANGDIRSVWGSSSLAVGHCNNDGSCVYYSIWNGSVVGSHPITVNSTSLIIDAYPSDPAYPCTSYRLHNWCDSPPPAMSFFHVYHCENNTWVKNSITGRPYSCAGAGFPSCGGTFDASTCPDTDS